MTNPDLDRALADVEAAFSPDVHSRASLVFKPYIVKRPNGGCQVLFPLTELDRLVDAVLALAVWQSSQKGTPT